MKSPQLLLPEQPGESKPGSSVHLKGLSWLPACAHIALLRGSERPDAQVLLTLFPSRVAPDQPRGWSTYYPTTVGQILATDQTLVATIEADLMRLPGHSLGLIVNEPLPIPEDWQPDTGNGKHWGASVAHIGQCHHLFAECDREGSAPADQLALAVAVFGVEPSFSIRTGGKSLHCYYGLSEAISPEKFRELQGLVIAVYEHLDPGCSVDRSLAKPNQVMRLAGGRHPRSGQIASIYGASNTVIDANALEVRLLTLLPPPPAPLACPPLRPRSPLAPPHRSRSAPTLADIADAMTGIEPYACCQGRRPEFIRFVGGLRAAVIAAGGTDQQALALAMAHSPGVIDATSYWRTNWSQISAGSFWYQASGHPAKRHGVRP